MSPELQRVLSASSVLVPSVRRPGPGRLRRHSRGPRFGGTARGPAGCAGTKQQRLGEIHHCGFVSLFICFFFFFFLKERFYPKLPVEAEFILVRNAINI